MAECKDCIHYCICSPYTAPNETYPEVDGCKHFCESLLPPCKIGDTVWAIRNYSGTKKIVPGTVSEMYFISEKMKLVIVVKHVTRGTWGKDIFGSYEEAEKRLKECQTKN